MYWTDIRWKICLPQSTSSFSLPAYETNTVTVAENDTVLVPPTFNEQQDTQRGVVKLHFYFEIYFPIK